MAQVLDPVTMLRPDVHFVKSGSQTCQDKPDRSVSGGFFFFSSSSEGLGVGFFLRLPSLEGLYPLYTNIIKYRLTTELHGVFYEFHC